MDLTPVSDITDSYSDIYIGTGNYGELVITFQKYLHNVSTTSVTGNVRIDFQIRLFLNDAVVDSNSLYSDDYYKKGTIQISYSDTNTNT